MSRGKVLLPVLAAAVLAGCASSSPEMKKEAGARMQMGISYLEQRNLPSAMRELSRASELDPGNPEIDMSLGLAYRMRGDLKEAEAHFRNAIRKKSDYAEAHNNLGIVLSSTGRGDEAIREFESAVSNVLYPTPEMAYYNMGEEYLRRKDYARAEERYRKAISLNERYAGAYLRLALVQGEAKRGNDAIGTLEACVRAVPEQGFAWMELGRAYLAAGRKEEALQAFRSAMANSTDSGMRKQASEYVNTLSGGKR